LEEGFRSPEGRGILGDESAQIWVVVAGAVVVEAGVGVEFFACELLGRVEEVWGALIQSLD